MFPGKWFHGEVDMMRFFHPITHLLNEELGWPMLWLLLHYQEIQPKNYDPRLEVSVVQHSSTGFLLGLWNLEGREKKKNLSPDVQLEETRIVQLLYAPSTTTKNETGKKLQKLEDVPSCSKRWRSVGANLSDIFLALLKSDDGALLRNNNLSQEFCCCSWKQALNWWKKGCTLKLAPIHSNVCKVLAPENFREECVGLQRFLPSWHSESNPTYVREWCQR